MLLSRVCKRSCFLSHPLLKSISTLQSSNVEVQLTKRPVAKPAINELVFGECLNPPSLTRTSIFGKNFTDHMLVCDWDSTNGWHAPQITPFGDFSLSPGVTGLHYGIQCFEGMKCYRTADGDIRMFRPDQNMKRMQSTGDMLTLPEFDAKEFLKLIKKFLQIDSEWVPYSESASLYIRPTFISTDPVIGVKPPAAARLYCIAGPVGPYYDTTGDDLFQSVKLMADPQYVRAWEGGSGAFKAGGNYAPTLRVQKIAASRGCQQVLWLYGDNEQMTEAGTMNFFCYMTNDEGEKELITPPLSSGLILPGVTRRSIIDMTTSWGEFKVTERAITMSEFKEKLANNQIIEVFGAGTACMIAPIHAILYEGQDLNIPTMTSGAELSKRLFTSLSDIQYGRVSHPWSESIYQDENNVWG